MTVASGAFAALMIVLIGSPANAGTPITATTFVSAALPANVKVYWSKIDRLTGAATGSLQTTTLYSESTVKIWLAADYLRVHPSPSATEKNRLRLMVVYSDDAAGDHFWSLNGGNASITRMISKCKLTDTKMTSGWWSKTLISARDLAKLGLCVVEGRAGAGPTQTAWIVDWMRHIAGDSLFGIKLALPADEASLVAAKNGWFNHSFDSRWRVLCLGVHPNWALAILTFYPSSLGRVYGEQLCETYTKDILGFIRPSHPRSWPHPPRPPLG